ncbi:MAG: GNAT family N-acetyltransferase [Pseudomonadota bacterium]|nr:GNAT family N-acetyltransferase [Pseudomonadota bacterium]
MIETRLGTGRLIVRRWRDADREPYGAMSADPAVMEWLGGTRTRAESDAQIDRFEAGIEHCGHGVWALERKADGAFLGFSALAVTDHPQPVPQGVELGWRLARHAWGFGYATEAARALLVHGFERLGLDEILSFTAATNLRSQAVMRRIGLVRRPELDFDHPTFEEGHTLRQHVVWGSRR